MLYCIIVPMKYFIKTSVLLMFLIFLFLEVLLYTYTVIFTIYLYIYWELPPLRYSQIRRVLQMHLLTLCLPVQYWKCIIVLSKW